MLHKIYLIFKVLIKTQHAGGSSERVTPDPISNSVVKPFSADDTAQRESRSSPAYCVLMQRMLFFVCKHTN